MFTRTLQFRKTLNVKKPIDSDEALTSCFDFDLGPYPLTPWLNEKTNDQRLRDLKRFNFFLPPKPNGRENIFVVTYGECSPNFEFRPSLEPKLLSRSKLSIDEFERCISNVNKVIGPLKEKHLFQERLIIYYILFGLLVVSTLAIALGIKVSYLIAVILAGLYCAGFVWLVLAVQLKGARLLKEIHFNLALVLRNENDRVLVRHGIKARPGYLSKWIEFHPCKVGMGTFSKSFMSSPQRDQSKSLIDDEENMFIRE